MKQVTNVITMLFVSAAAFAQTNDSTMQGNSSRTADTTRRTINSNTTNKNGSMNSNTANMNTGVWPDTAGLYRWYDTGYYRRNRGNFDSLVKERRMMWNEQQSYFVRGAGDTINPYNRENWLRDSMRFSSQNWDSLSAWQKDYRWGEAANLQTDNQYNNNATMSGDSANLSATNAGTTGTNPSTTNGDTSIERTTQGEAANRTGKATTKSGSNSKSATYHSEKESTETTGASSAKSTTSKSKAGSAKNRVYMKDNMLMLYKNGISSKVSKSIKLNNGTVVLANGTIKMPDGSTNKLKNGESILLDSKPQEKQ